MDISELPKVGAKIAELGTKLKSLREKESTIKTEIAEIETELRPLIVDHAKLLSDFVGPLGTAAVAPSVQSSGHVPTLGVVAPNQDSILKKVEEFMATTEPDEDGKMPSAFEVAQILKLDPFEVRHAMFQAMSRSAR